MRGHAPEKYAIAYWSLVTLGTCAVLVTAYLGGTAVFRHGVGVLNG